MYNNSCGQWYWLKGSPTVKEVGHIITKNIHPDRVLPFWVLGAVAAGRRTIKVGNDIAYLTTGDYFLLPPNVRHCGIEEDDHDVYFIHFFMEGLSKAPPLKINTNDIILSIFGQLPNDINLLQYFNYIYEQFKLKAVSNYFLKIQLISILYQISFYSQKMRTWINHNNKKADNIMDFIYRHYTEKLDSIRLEKEFGISYRQLNNIFKRKYNTTIKQKIIELRIQNAYDLLIQGESIANAAIKSGFNDYYYFLKSFKKIKKLTPSELRKKYFYKKGV